MNDIAIFDFTCFGKLAIKLKIYLSNILYSLIVHNSIHVRRGILFYSMKFKIVLILLLDYNKTNQ